MADNHYYNFYHRLFDEHFNAQIHILLIVGYDEIYQVNATLSIMNTVTVTVDGTRLITVLDLISEHALISGHPPFFVLKKIIHFFNFF